MVYKIHLARQPTIFLCISLAAAQFCLQYALKALDAHGPTASISSTKNFDGFWAMSVGIAALREWQE